MLGSRIVDGHTSRGSADEYRTDRFLPYTAWTAESPFHTDSWNHSQLMPASSAAVGFPFATRNLENSHGVVYGEDSRTATPILLNRFNWRSHSIAWLGAPGSGKSSATKLEIFRSYIAFDDIQILIVGPKKEYSSISRKPNGSKTALEEGKDYSFNNQVRRF